VARPDWTGVGYLIGGADVFMTRRDITQITDKELGLITEVVEKEVRLAHGKIESVEIESDYPDRDNIRYLITMRVTSHPIDDDPDDG
jgi:hypothetical protein